jgi:hypothetical protein
MPIFMVCESFRMGAASRRLLPQERWRREVRDYNPKAKTKERRARFDTAEPAATNSKAAAG